MSSIFTVKAKISAKDHLKVDKQHQALTCIFSFDEKYITSAELYEHLFDNFNKYKKAKIDVKSFIDCGFKKIKEHTVLLIIRTIVDHINHSPYSMKTKKESVKEIELINDIKEKDYVHEISSLIKAQRECKNLQELPPNLLRPSDFIKAAQKLLENSSVEIEIIKKVDLKKHNLNLIHNVGKASDDEACLIILKYLPIKDQKAIALVGKGVCYDSGGLNIKTGNYMCGMKFDMSGAAVSLNTMYAIEKSKLQKNVVVLLPVVENLVNQDAYRADDVIVSHNGLTVEITNTDAEGRLILADAISYAAKTFAPSCIITIATLTGAVGYALGYKHAGVWSTDDKNWEKISDAALEAGEYLWRLPLHKSFLVGLKSVIADISNSSKTGAGGSSRAAMFLKEFTNNIPFIHIDIANVANFESSNIATASLLRTLFYFLKNK